MKTVLIIAMIIFSTALFSPGATAQIPHISIYAHALYATPLDNSSETLYNGGAGAVGGILIGKKTTRFNASVGYTHFFSDHVNPLGDETYIPFKAGIRQYIPFSLNFLFVQGDLGAGYVSNKHTDGSDSRFAFDFGAGVKFAGFEGALIWDNFKEKDPSGLSSWLTIQAGFNLGF
ncbi:MAG: hypothetical protein ABJB05_09695 [Parafilimonas sp.]